MSRNETFYYVVVTINGEQHFINQDLDYTDNFDEVYKFPTREAAEDFIGRHKLNGKEARAMQYTQ